MEMYTWHMHKYNYGLYILNFITVKYGWKQVSPECFDKNLSYQFLMKCIETFMEYKKILIVLYQQMLLIWFKLKIVD
jgi:hypothetical protein